MNKKYAIIFFFLVIFLLSGTRVIQAAESAYGPAIITNSYELSRSKVDRAIQLGNLFEDFVEVTNFGNAPLRVTATFKGEVTPYVSSKKSEILVEPKNATRWYFTIKASETGNYQGIISFTGGITEEIPVNLSITTDSLDPLYLIDIFPIKNSVILQKPFSFKIDITKLKPLPLENVTFIYKLFEGNKTPVILGTEKRSFDNSIQLIKTFDFPSEAKSGEYTFQVISEYENKTIFTESLFQANVSFFSRKLFGIPFWVIFLITGIILSGIVIGLLIYRHIQGKKKYKMHLDMKTLPKKDKKFLWLGKIAEKKNFAYLDPHRLTTHSIVAGSTGGGKSIAAQVLIEEALKQNICVIVFDPTAQWSGMLRKLEDKKMFAYYSKFGMKKNEARGFPGNIRAVKDARQIIKIEKYFEPGHIQIFTLNKLQPKDMDIFIANIIRQIFKSDPKEYPTLRTLLVFDEIHRILPKFGGSGEGFIQIERACREFRKWGYGVALISQVLSDFAGQIKANISTEIQLRTRDEGDLNRIKTKYGDEFLQSLVKASVGVGMFVNPAYNHANPYFINFRPILHNTRRLSDEELDQYNQYNDQVEDLEYQIEQLEELKIDVFDLKMELKLVKDKIMVGNFSVVDIYLEGLKPRIQKQWEKLGKKPKKKEIELADLDEIKKSIEEAKASHEKAEAQLAETKKEETAEKADPLKELEEKQFAPLILDNGMMISSLKELKSVLPAIDDEIFAIHINEEKNDVAKWFEQIDEAYGKSLTSIIKKEELVKKINEFKPGKKEEIKKESSESKEKEKPEKDKNEKVKQEKTKDE